MAEARRSAEPGLRGSDSRRPLLVLILQERTASELDPSRAADPARVTSERPRQPPLTEGDSSAA